MTKKLAAKKSTLIAFILILAITLGTCVAMVSLPKQASAEPGFLGNIKIINHNDNQIGIKIDGVKSVDKAEVGGDGNFWQAQEHKPYQEAFFKKFIFNGASLWNNLQQNVPDTYARGSYNSGGYTYLINTYRNGFNKGDVIMFKKGMQALYGTIPGASGRIEGHALSEQTLEYDRYFVFDNWNFVPAKVLQDVTASQDYVVVGQVAQLTPKFLPVYSYMADAPNTKIDMWTSAATGWGSGCLSKAITYTSSDETIATVSGAGVVTGVKPGKVVITATHVDSNEKIQNTIVVKGSQNDLTTLAVEVSGGQPVISGGVSGSAIASLTVADNAFFSQLTLNGEPMFGAGVAAALAADGKVTINKALAANDVICVKAGFSPITSADGTTAILADSALAKDVYYKYDGTNIAKLAPFTLAAATDVLQVRENKVIAPTFASGVTDTNIVWSSSADYMVSVDQAGNLQANNYVTGAANPYVGNISAPTQDANFPNNVTITAKHIGTGEVATCVVTVAETIEDMDMELVWVNSKTIGFKYKGVTTGRMVKSDVMSDTQQKKNVLVRRDGKPRMNWDIFPFFYGNNYLNNDLMTSFSYGDTAPSTNLGDSRFSLVICTNYYDIKQGDVFFAAKGLRPFAFTNGLGYYDDSMELKGDICFKLVGKEFVKMAPKQFNESNYQVKVGKTIPTAMSKLHEICSSKVPFTYTMQDPTIATVDAAGVVTGVTAGTTTLVATTEGGLTTATTSIEVLEAGNVTLPADESVTYGSTKTITAVTNDAGGTFTWSSDNTDVVSVVGDGLNAVITAAALGAANITVSYNAGEKTDVMTITVIPGLTFALPNTDTNIEVSHTVQTTATSTPSQGVTITYASSDPTYATISASGLITAVKAGGDVTFTATATMDGAGNEAIKNSKTVNLNTFAITGFSFNKVETVGNNDPMFYFDSAKTDIKITEGMHSPIRIEEYKNALPDFFQNILITQTIGTAGVPVKFNEYWHTDIGHQPQITVRPERIEFYWYDVDHTNPDGSTWTKAAIEEGTVITFKAGFKPAYGDATGNYYAHCALSQDVSYRCVNGVWIEAVEPGSAFRIISIDPVEQNEFMMTLNVYTTTALRGEEIVSGDKIKLCGYTIDAINAANPNGVKLLLLKDTISFKLDPKVVMDGKKIFDTTIDGNQIKLEILSGYTTPTNYHCDAAYKNVFYADVKWWAAEPQTLTSDEKLVISSVERKDEGNNKGIIVKFGNTNKIFEHMAYGDTVHVNAIPAWLNKLPYGAQLDHQISTGIKQAVWNGIYLNGKSIKYMMFDSGTSTEADQSTIVAVHFHYANNSIRFVFDDNFAAINGLDWSKEVVLTFDAELFHTDTGAKFAKDSSYVYNPQTKAWAAKYAYNLTIDSTKSVEAGKNATINATLTSDPVGGATAITWASSNTSVATVVNGVVTGVKAGTATITATAPDGTSKTCTVTVTAVVDPTPTPDPDPTPGDDKKSGCGSSASSASAMAAVISVITLGLVLSLKKRSSNKN